MRTETSGAIGDQDKTVTPQPNPSQNNMQRDQHESCNSVPFDHGQNLASLSGPRAALSVMFQCGSPASLLDVGCGIGQWVQAARELGVKDAWGLDGVRIPSASLHFPAENFLTQPLTKPFSLARRFDVALCLEVGEHLDSEHARTLIETLVAHADTIYFSGACPGQPGQHHVNCQWPAYWQQLFNEQGYACSDRLRWMLWADERIEPWYRQNIFVAKREPTLAGKEARIPPVVHPALLPFLLQGEEIAKVETGRMSLSWYGAILPKALWAKLQRRTAALTKQDSVDLTKS
ncbi:hypothetical protein TBR22_A53000 [Luteitalea sp. TBR-22]|uniref:class I SAM-dependent methyltransferase n=1 Tax=Luteitalea sp. TBR-22 TaxID=2802971 RepID=UPI001AF3BCA4|nr:methyltransferase domain-containing protein [Luteitalea sp. TBR-22]BCS36063.1 hypothetical protein TBR22_A53000 [Luteitalea sp. TBR-22]